jgi:hypothetical protein
VTLAAFLLPAGRFKPIFSNFSRSKRPPFFDFALSQSYTQSLMLIHWDITKLEIQLYNGVLGSQPVLN